MAMAAIMLLAILAAAMVVAVAGIKEAIKDTKGERTMSIRKQDKNLAKRHYLMTAITGIPFIVCWIIGVTNNQFFWPACIIGGAIAIGGLTLQTLRFRHYCCPDCRTLLPKPATIPGAKIEYVCQRCDVIWETGFSVPKD
jgi:hypothetical protein